MGTDHDDSTGDRAEPPHTGVSELDAMVQDISTLDNRPLEEHVNALESAHEALRRAMDQH